MSQTSVNFLHLMSSIHFDHILKLGKGLEFHFLPGGTLNLVADSRIPDCGLRSHKWVSAVTLSPKSVPSGTCLSGKCFKISKWVPFTYRPSTFQSSVFVLVFVLSGSAHEPFIKQVFRSLQLFSFPEHMPLWF